jgi:hypothetical protein
MVRKEDYSNISEYDSAFNSEIFYESEHVSDMENIGPSELDQPTEPRSLTASEFDFEIFSESGKILRDMHMNSMEQQFPDFIFAEEKMNFKPDSSKWTEEEKMSDFANFLLHGDHSVKKG